jgi:hypothetical protein
MNGHSNAPYVNRTRFVIEKQAWRFRLDHASRRAYGAKIASLYPLSYWNIIATVSLDHYPAILPL